MFLEESTIDRYYELNNRIKAVELRIITGEGENLGVMKTQDALNLAREKGLDLIVITPNSVPPVAKILDFKKFLYQERKKKSTAKVKSKKSELKEIKLGPYTGEGDVTRWVERAKEFLEEGNRVKVTVTLRGRENLYPDLGFAKINKFQEALSAEARQESETKQSGNIISTVFVSK